MFVCVCACVYSSAVACNPIRIGRIAVVHVAHDGDAGINGDDVGDGVGARREGRNRAAVTDQP